MPDPHGNALDRDGDVRFCVPVYLKPIVPRQ